ncbi:MAG: hypothetical protein AAF108_06050 [Planctomycetota bacterium]
MKTLLGLGVWPARATAVLLAGALNAAALSAWVTTGAHGFSRAASEDTSVEPEADGEAFDDLFGEFDDEPAEEAEPEKAVDRSYAFGLLPGGVGVPTLSVATVGGVSGVLVISVVALTLGVSTKGAQ